MSRGIALLFLGPRHYMGVGGSPPRLDRLYSRERPGTHCTGGWVGPRTGLDWRTISSSKGFDPRTVQPVAQSLYRLNYPAHNYYEKAQNKIKFPKTLISAYIGAEPATVRFKVLSSHLLQKYSDIKIYTGCFTTLGHNCRR